VQLELACAVGVVDDAINRALAAQLAEESAQLAHGFFVGGGHGQGAHRRFLSLIFGAGRVFADKISGSPAAREDDGRATAGNVVVVTEIDRLGHSTRDLLDLSHQIGEAGASFKTLGDPLFHATTSQASWSARFSPPLPSSSAT
jgi:hypothetical protein